MNETDKNEIYAALAGLGGILTLAACIGIYCKLTSRDRGVRPVNNAFQEGSEVPPLYSRQDHDPSLPPYSQNTRGDGATERSTQQPTGSVSHSSYHNNQPGTEARR